MSEEDRRRGKALGEQLQALRGALTSEQMAQQAKVKVDTLRRIEAGAVPTPGFFMVGQIVKAAGGTLDQLWAETNDVTSTAGQP